MNTQATGWGELERLQSVKIRKAPPRETAGGNWDWWFSLPASRRSAISRDFMDPDGIDPDAVAAIMATSVDSAMEHWLVAVDMTRKRSRALDLTENEIWGDPETATMKTPAIESLVGPAEVAEQLGVAQRTISQWRWRGVMPAELRTISGIPVWEWQDIEYWAQDTGRLDHGE